MRHKSALKMRLFHYRSFLFFLSRILSLYLAAEYPDLILNGTLVLHFLFNPSFELLNLDERTDFNP